MNKRFRPALGTRIVARNRVEKHRVKDGFKDPIRTLWPVVDECVEGIFVGWRVLAQGITDYVQHAEDDVVWMFMPKLHFEAWLIVEDPRMNPVYVLPDDVVEIDGMNLQCTHFFLRDNAGDSNYAAISIEQVTDDWPGWLRAHASYLLKDGWHEVGWQEWFLAKEGHK